MATDRERALIVAIGDSTTAGTPGFRSPAEAPPDGEGDVESQYPFWLMQTHPEWRVLNRGVNGERSDQIRARFSREIVDVHPAVAILIAGVNDIYQGRPAAAVQRELERMYQTARDNGIPLVAGTILPYNTATLEANNAIRAVNSWIEEYVNACDTLAFCNVRAAVAAPGQPDRLVSSPDGLHPSPDGYRLMALALEPAVKRLLGRART